MKIRKNLNRKEKLGNHEDFQYLPLASSDRPLQNFKVHLFRVGKPWKLRTLKYENLEN